MAESELDKSIAKAFRAAFWLMVIHSLIMGLIMTAAAIFICVVAANIVRPSESHNVHIQESARTFDDNVREVLKRENKVN